MSPHSQFLSLDKPRIVFTVCCSAVSGVATRHTLDPGAGARVSHLTASFPFRSWMACVLGSFLERMVDLLLSRGKTRKGNAKRKEGDRLNNQIWLRP